MERWTSPNWTSGTPIISILLTTPVETEGWLILSSLLKFQGSNSLCIWCNQTDIWLFTILKHWKIVPCIVSERNSNYFNLLDFFKCKYIRQVRVGKDCPWIKSQNVTFTAIKMKFFGLPNKSNYMQWLKKLLFFGNFPELGRSCPVVL